MASDNSACLVSADAHSKEVASLEVPAGNNDACSEVPTDNNAEAAALADTSLGSVEVASGKIACFVSADSLLHHPSHIFIHSFVDHASYYM